MAYFVDGLATELRKYGLTVVEVEGSKTRGYAGRGMTKVDATMWHHTATARSAFLRSPAPTLAMCTYGRAGLAGPLTQLLLARNGVVYVIATGWSNHAGTGKWTNIDWHRGNDQSLGVEVESSGIAPWDLTPEQLHTAPILGAALRLIFGHANDPSHAEYSDAGKIDIAGWPGGWGGLRKEISAVRFGGLQSGTFTPIQEDDMPYNDWPKADKDALVRDLWSYKGTDETRDAYWYQRNPGYHVWRERIASTYDKPDAEGNQPTYQAATFLSTNNKRINSLVLDELPRLLSMLGELADSEDATATQLRAQIKAAIEGLQFGLVEQPNPE